MTIEHILHDIGIMIIWMGITYFIVRKNGIR